MAKPDIIDTIVSEWNRALDIPSSSSADYDDFFEAGGNSLLAMGLIDELEERLGSAPSIQSFFVSPSLRMIEEFYGVSRGTPND
jgi:acyl carrier protein